MIASMRSVKSDPESNKPRYMKSTGERSEEQ